MYQTELNPGGVNEEFGGVLSPIGEVLRCAMEFYSAHPQIERRIIRLQDRHALRKKRQRVADGQVCGGQGPELLAVAANGNARLQLGSGRPRMHPQNVFLFAMVRATVGGPHSRIGLTLAMESMSVRALLHPATPVFPGATTILENINLIDGKTLGGWLKLQLRWLQGLEQSTHGWQQVTVDSTAIEAAAAFPVDSMLLVKAVEVLWRVFARTYAQLNIAVQKLPKVKRWRKQLQLAHKTISLGSGKKAATRIRKQLYAQMVEQALLLIGNLLKVRQELLEQQVRATQQLQGRALRAAQRYEQLFGARLRHCVQVLEQINERVLNKGKLAAIDKLLSLCEADAAIIVKGGREAVFGYKVQLAFNQPGYCTAALINQGNAADSTSLEPVLLQQNKNTGITVTRLSVDDGYAGRQTAAKVTTAGVTELSVSGSKGKRQLGEAAYADPSMTALRAWRPAAEARIFTFKTNQHAHRLKRFGRAAASSEVLAKVLIFNIDCLLRRRREKTKPPAATAA